MKTEGIQVCDKCRSSVPDGEGTVTDRGRFRWWWIPAGTVAAVVLVLLVGPCRAPSSVSEAPAPVIHGIPDFGPEIEVLWEQQGREAMMGYWVHVLAPPMSRQQLTELGRQVVAETKRRGFRSPARAYIYYNREDFALKRLGLWHEALCLNMLSPGFEVNFLGPVPEKPTPQGCFEAAINSTFGFRMAGGKPSDYGYDSLVTFDESTGSVHAVDRQLAYLKWPATMQTIIDLVCKRYFCSGWRLWGGAPGIRAVEITFFDRRGLKVGRVRVSREAYDAAQKAWCQKRRVLVRREIERALTELEGRHDARVISDKAFRQQRGILARQQHQLYEDVWVAVFRHLKVDVDEKLPTEAPARFWQLDGYFR